MQRRCTKRTLDLRESEFKHRFSSVVVTNNPSQQKLHYEYNTFHIHHNTKHHVVNYKHEKINNNDIPSSKFSQQRI